MLVERGMCLVLLCQKASTSQDALDSIADPMDKAALEAPRKLPFAEFW